MRNFNRNPYKNLDGEIHRLKVKRRWLIAKLVLEIIVLGAVLYWVFWS